MNKHMMYITYFKDGKIHKIGPFYHITFEVFDVQGLDKWVTYKVQKRDLTFTHITLPCHHSIDATI